MASLTHVYDEFLQTEIAQKVKRIYRSRGYEQMTIIVCEDAFFAEAVYIRRTSKMRYYLFHNKDCICCKRLTEVIPKLTALLQEILLHFTNPAAWLRAYEQTNRTGLKSR